MGAGHGLRGHLRRTAELETLDVRLTYYQIAPIDHPLYPDFSAAELDVFFNDLLRQYLPGHGGSWTGWKPGTGALGPCNFRFQLTVPDSAPLPGDLSACAAGKAEQKGGTRLFCQAPPASAKR
nr:hypothetical protein [Faecalibacterium prausnitzii]